MPLGYNNEMDYHLVSDVMCLAPYTWIVCHPSKRITLHVVTMVHSLSLACEHAIHFKCHPSRLSVSWLCEFAHRHRHRSAYSGPDNHHIFLVCVIHTV